MKLPSKGRSALILASTLSAGLLYADYKESIRYHELSDELTLRGLPLPDGSGVSVTQVEADYISSGNYLPDSGHSDFSGKIISDQSGGGSPSDHATWVGRLLYGNSNSISPGITAVDAYSANDFLNGSWRTGVPPIEQNPLQNHSWVYSSTSSSVNTDMILRMDYAAARDAFLPVAGLDNADYPNPPPSTPSEIPAVYASAYNGLSVGVSDGTHRTGTTNYDGTGRIKPEIVAPGRLPGSSAASPQYTSYATPAVTSAAALLIDAAAGNSDAKNPLVLKATLLAAADKAISPDWDQTATRPLDEVYGAGELDIYESYFIQQAGQQGDGSPLNTRGWNLANLGQNGSHSYGITVPNGFELRDLSLLITWNREVGYQRLNWSNPFSGSLADLSLQLTGTGIATQTSDSPVDNLEHIWRGSGASLAAGNYTVSVSTDDSVEYAIAWRSQLYQDYVLWQSIHFSSGTAIDQQDPEDDPDGDGLVNRLEQAFGGDPEVADRTIAPVSSVVEAGGQRYLQISFRRPTFENALDYTVETATELDGLWSSTAGEVTAISITSEPDGYERYTYQRLAAVSQHEKAFLRVRVSQQQ